MKIHADFLGKSFEENIKLIDEQIAKQKTKWTLTSLSWCDYADVSQIIRLHIYKKWHLFDLSKPPRPYLNVIISHQIRNLIRNLYSNYSRPCLKCDAAVDKSGCKIYGEQCVKCPLYAYWQKRKQPATHIKIPVSIENHVNEIKNIPDDNINIFKNIALLHNRMKETLKPREYLVYDCLFIQNLEESETAKKLDFAFNEKRKSNPCRQIFNIKRNIIKKVKKCLADGELDLF